MLGFKRGVRASSFSSKDQPKCSTPGAVFECLEDRRLLSTSSFAVGLPVVDPLPVTVVPATTTAVGVTIHAEAGDLFSGTVGILKNFVLPPSPLGSRIRGGVGLQESINWGDGTKPSPGWLVPGPAQGQFLVKGSHIYAKPGTYKVTVSVIWGPLPGSGILIASRLLQTIHSTAIVAEDEDGGVTLTEIAGMKFKADVGSFDLRSIDLILTATIDWGDGSKPAAGQIVGQFATGEYSVFGSHTYAKAGKYQVKVTVVSRLAGSPDNLPPTGWVAIWTRTINVLGNA